MHEVLEKVGDGLANAFLMAWEVWWALVLGFAISAIVQAWVPRERIERSLGGRSPRAVGLATALGAASSSCSYAAVAIAKSLFQKGASAISALAFQFASTNIVFELGIVIWTLLGWRFTLAEFIGGLVMIALMAVLLRVFVSARVEAAARAHAQDAEASHQHHSAGTNMPFSARLTSVDAWSDVAHNFRNDWGMLWREIGIGFLLAGFAGLVSNHFYDGLFARHWSSVPRALENIVMGPLVAVLSFVCSVGNVPLAAVLWSGGISFAGVLAFLFADLIIVPLIAVYRRYYGGAFAARITALMFVTMAAAALIVSGVFSATGLEPHARPTRASIFEPVTVDYRLVLNVLATVVSAALVGLALRRGATDPVCGMRVDRGRSLTLESDGHTHHFCSERCRGSFAGARDGASAAPRREPVR